MVTSNTWWESYNWQFRICDNELQAVLTDSGLWFAGIRWGRHNVWSGLWSRYTQISGPIKMPCFKTWWPRFSDYLGHCNHDKGMLICTKILLATCKVKLKVYKIIRKMIIVFYCFVLILIIKWSEYVIVIAFIYPFIPWNIYLKPSSISI